MCTIPKKVKSGCPQGGILSPILYNLYVSDLPKIIKSYNFQWADDTVLISVIKSINDYNVLQNDIKNFEEYCLEKELKLNECKTRHLRITLRKNCDFPKYLLKNKSIEKTDSHKHLGVTYDSKMSFNGHTSDIIKKSFSKFNFLKQVCKRVNGLTFLQLYKTYILCIIEYSNSCWVPNKSQSDQIERIQRRITDFICGKLGKYDLTYQERLEFLDLKTIKNRREKCALSLVQKIKCNQKYFPNEWADYFVFTDTRNGIFFKTNL